MLELQKFVLLHVCDDIILFKKEIQKSLAWLNFEELEIFRDWLFKTFGSTHIDLINEVLMAQKS